MSDAGKTGLGPAGLLIANGWTQFAYARARNNNPIGPNEANAVCFCAYGAIKRAYEITDGSSCLNHSAGEKLIAAIGTRDVGVWNDNPNRTHKEVIEAFRKAGI